ncbi:MAG TPA: tRNA uridine-5-carboxymethylaminomethyl(34) synthesis GTPase MnmE [Aquabacterium sp.]|uniref:tRNA uridine-5-carboxymethylaminomethyl(34) synthesis GTPase MnmE n=1 Tax=Aquabacterium sp. TaxID=1872578 RepID=UPI002E36C3F2|nr:tRNA uridine-5-carboxymethylaminomethyl(34) synthesis GTPase MnmE [Aquabacterium sp.]HEX5373909.1 tRNA uridine-5-carboxymethylaminomethyl(34) synthesis GTPase MnmE [Aquabacterium sp.]
MAWTDKNSPIVAVATAPGRGAVGIVRVSGRGLAPLAHALTGRTLVPRQASYGPLRDAQGQAIDHGLALYFPAPHSYTGEDVLELQAHGGPVVLQLLVARCLEAAEAIDAASGRPCLPGLRLAEPGEFTERAFLNDKIDLAQAEAIADLIDASTEAAARSASRSLGGAFSNEVNALRDRLIDLRMLVEATLDFPEEEIDFLEKARARERLDAVAAALDAVLVQARQGALLREGLQVVLAGQPNAGKSSLLNALAGAELAIVTPIAGTTRDKVSETIQIEGVPLKVIDTAGLRAQHEASDEVERIGMARSWEAIGQADAVLFLHDLTRVDDAVYAQADADIAARVAEAIEGRVQVVHVFNKADACAPERVVQALAMPGAPPGQAVALSARTGDGLSELRRLLLDLAGWQHNPEGVFIARQRHVQALRQAREHLALAQAHAAQSDGALDLLAEELRLAHDALGRITGAFSADDLLGEIFSRFCIGK